MVHALSAFRAVGLAPALQERRLAIPTASDRHQLPVYKVRQHQVRQVSRRSVELQAGENIRPHPVPSPRNSVLTLIAQAAAMLDGDKLDLCNILQVLEDLCAGRLSEHGGSLPHVGEADDEGEGGRPFVLAEVTRHRLAQISHEISSAFSKAEMQHRKKYDITGPRITHPVCTNPPRPYKIRSWHRFRNSARAMRTSATAAGT